MRERGEVRIGGYLYNEFAEIIDYGPSLTSARCIVPCDSTGTSIVACEDHTTLESRPSWEFWRVRVYRLRFGDWSWGWTFFARTWSSIEDVWVLFFETAGYSERLEWCCERWVWTFEGGFEPEDYI